MQKNLGFVIPNIVIENEADGIGRWYLGSVPLGFRATGTMWTIGADHYWYLDGTKTTKLAEIPVEDYNAEFDALLAARQAEFITWFNGMKGQLTTDAAGNLQTQIDWNEAVALFGLNAVTTTFNADGTITSIIDTNTTKVTTFNTDGSITETITINGILMYTKTTTFTGSQITTTYVKNNE